MHLILKKKRITHIVKKIMKLYNQLHENFVKYAKLKHDSFKLISSNLISEIYPSTSIDSMKVKSFKGISFAIYKK